ncbi:hypothetical protein [Nocardia terpenica]|uniref:Uncharacterized protein n=1 Tax=Nocardia terpenica TaxID=455432 RepID=A0A291RCT9_9NOCA|nr:hypothetical protein [Nocardia terpenica]ATL64932.1 hypothetical protein CRH09_00470 [Nocardia terpenica]
MRVSDAVAGGDRREILLALRQTVAEAIDGNPHPRDLSALVRAQVNINRELAELEAANASKTGVAPSLRELQDRAKNRAKKKGPRVLVL